MISFLSNNIGTIIVGLIVLIGVIGAVIYLIKSRKEGKCVGCDGACKFCPSQSEHNYK